MLSFGERSVEYGYNKGTIQGKAAMLALLLELKDKYKKR